MCTEINLLNAKLHLPQKDLDHYRRLLKRGEKIFLLTEEEKKRFDQINFDATDPKTVIAEFRLASDMTQVSLQDIIGIGILEDNLITLKLKKTINPDD